VLDLRYLREMALPRDLLRLADRMFGPNLRSEHSDFAVKPSKRIFAIRTVSSVGLEHYFDRVGVTGSNPVQSTNNLRFKK
jgi:hypothetical protein